MNLQQLLPDKPDAIYSAAIAGSIAIIVGFFANRHALKRLRLELQHQANQRELERQFSLKRDIYIPLLEAATNATSYYGQIATVPTELIRQPEPLNSLARHIAKLNGVASKEVIESVHLAQKALLIGIVKLFEERQKIDALMIQVSSVESQIKMFESKGESFTQRFEKHIDAGTGDSELRNLLVRFINENQQAVEKLYEQKNHLSLQKVAAELRVTRQAMQDLQRISPLMRTALVAIRKDLGMQIDEAWLAGAFQESSKEISNAMNTFLGNLETLLNQAQKPKV